MEETTSSEQGRAAVEPGDQPLNPDEEIAEIEKLLAAEPDDFQARCRLGELYFSKGRLDDALVEVKKSIEMAEGIRAEMNRSLAMYYSNLGTIYATKNMADEAEAEFKRALDVFQYDVLALFNLGRLCADKKKYMDAKGYYERLVEITPDDPMAWYNLAGVYVELDNPQVSDYNTIDIAIQCYLRTLELDPKHLEGELQADGAGAQSQENRSRHQSDGGRRRAQCGRAAGLLQPDQRLRQVQDVRAGRAGPAAVERTICEAE